MTRLSNPQINEIIRCITGPISILGSCIILYLVWAGKGKKNAYHRFMIGISLSDIVFTTAFLFGVTPLPKGLTPGAMGNTTTCELRAFFVQWFGVLEPLYDVCLEFYFVAVICYNIKPEEFTKRYERWMHAFVNILAFGTAIIGLVAQIYNPLVGKASGCYINSYPQGCTGEDCIRGEHARTYLFFLGVLPYYIILFLLYGSLILIVWTVLRKDCKARRFQPPSQPSQLSRRRSSSILLQRPVLSITRPVTTQAISYGVVFTITYLAHTILRTILYFDRLATQNPSVVTIAFLSDFFLPLQGFFNLILYIKPKFNKLRKTFPSKSFLWCVRMSISRKPIQDIQIQVLNADERGHVESSAVRDSDDNDDDPCCADENNNNGNRGNNSMKESYASNGAKQSGRKSSSVLFEESPDDGVITVQTSITDEENNHGGSSCLDLTNREDEQKQEEEDDDVEMPLY